MFLIIVVLALFSIKFFHKFHFSSRFAELSSSIFLQAGYPVYLFSTYVPTPFVPFTVSKLKCIAGVMVTASHNPKEDNGYKVYGSNGSQIISPVDKSIQNFILKNLEPLESSWQTGILKTCDKLSDPLKEITDDYMRIVSSSLLDKHREINLKTKLKFTHTSMHGVGHNYVVKAMDVVNLKVIPVAEQKDPHPDFPTVK